MCSFPRSKAVVKKKKHQSTIICLGPHDQSKKITIIWLILCIGFRHDQFIHYVALENHTVWQRSLLIIDVLIGTCVLLDHPWWAWIILSWGCEKLMVHASSYRTWFVKFGRSYGHYITNHTRWAPISYECSYKAYLWTVGDYCICTHCGIRPKKTQQNRKKTGFTQAYLYLPYNIVI